VYGEALACAGKQAAGRWTKDGSKVGPGVFRRVQPMPTDIARYSIELFKEGGDGVEQVLDRHADIKIARSIYRTCIDQYPGRLIMPCDGTRVLTRSDRPDTMR